MSIKAGDLRHVVTLQKPGNTVNEKGRRITGWVDVATVRAGKADVSGREFYVAQAYHAEDVVTFTLRYRSDVTTQWRLKHHGAVYNILEVNHLGYMRDFMRLKCRLVTGEANH